MDFSFTEDQNAIRDLANQIFTDRSTDEFLMGFSRSDATYDDQLWNTLAEQGLLGICVPEDFGGTGLGFVELCSILEEQGRRVAPVPLFSSLVLGGLPIAQFGNDAQKEKWLTPMAAGQKKLTAAVAELGMTTAMIPTVTAKKDGDDWVLNGEKHAVADGAVADCILVPAVDDNGQNTFFLLDTQAEGVTVTGQSNFSGETKASLKLDNAKLNADAVLGKQGQGDEIMNWLEQYADTALSAMQLGVCDEALKRTAEFTCERKQFGSPIGSFQAVAMRAADAFIDLEAMRSTTWQAMWRLSEGRDCDIEIRAAKWWACTGGHRVVHAAQHLHGGMGADVEYPIHRFFIMAKEISFMLGSSAVQLSKLGQELANNDKTGVQALVV